MKHSKFSIVQAISRFSVKTRVWALCLVPVLGLLVLGAMQVLNKYEAFSNADHALQMAEDVPAISELIHQLQKERGMSAGFISSGGAKFVSELPAQQLETSQALQDFQRGLAEIRSNSFGDEFVKRNASANDMLAELGAKRGSVGSLQISVGSMAGYYTGIIAELLSAVEVSVDYVADINVKRQSMALSAFLNGKEYAGIERAVGTGIFASGEITQASFLKFGNLVSLQGVMFDTFMKFGLEPLKEMYVETTSSPIYELVLTYREVLNGAPFGGSLAFPGAERWFEATTQRINLLKQVDDAAVHNLISFVEKNRASSLRDLQFILVLNALIVGITVVFALFVVRSIVGPVVNLTGVMKALSKGDSKVEVSGRENLDELGDMARAVEVFKQNAVEVERLNTEEQKRLDSSRSRNLAMTSLVEELGVAVDAAVRGDFSRRIDVALDEKDLSGVAQSVNTLVEIVERGLLETGGVLSALADTDLTLRVNGDYQGAFLELKQDTNAVADRLSEVVGQLRQTSGELKSATGEILAGANDLSERTTKQAATIEETSATMEQLSTTVIENAKMAESVGENAASVANAANEGGEVMAQTTEAMERITSSSAKISNIIGMIDDIAFQTNLLALNASVEAARAGEAGKGFAVVAVEVRRLAQSAAKASSEVKELIDQSAVEVQQGSKLVALASQKLENMMDGAKKNKVIIGEVVAANKEQAASIDEVNVAVRQMDEMTQHNAALVEQTNAAIEQTDNQVGELDKIIEVFKLVQNAGATQKSLFVASAGAPVPEVKRMQGKVRSAAKSYLSQGSSALDNDWDEF